MASFTAGTTFVDGVSNDVTAAKLGALVTNATPTSGFIQDRTAETVTATNDTLLIGDASDSNNLKRITIANFAQTLPTAKVTTGTIETGTFGTTTSTAATITTLTAGTTTSTAATITTGTIPTLVATTLVTTGTGTAAAPAIVPTGDTNTGIFFPAADTIAFAEGGAEGMRIDSSGNVGVGTASPRSPLDVNGNIYVAGGNQIQITGSPGTTGLQLFGQDAAESLIGTMSSQSLVLRTNATERLRITSSGAVGIGTTSPRTIFESSGVVASSGSSGGFQIYDRSTNVNSVIFYSPQVGDFRIYDVSSTSDRFKIDTNGDCLVISNARIGYGAGSGGTVTQGTSKTTGVTLNKPTGQITMHNANLANAATVRFTLTNSFISAVDILVVNATAFAGYTTTCENTATGAATIRVTNVSGGGLAEAVTLQFAVIKGSAT